MDVPNCHGRQRHRWRPALSAVLMFAVAGFAGSAHAVEFDAGLMAPMMKDAAALKGQAQDFSVKYLALRESAPEQLIKNAALAGQQFDLKWQVQQAINQRKPLDELAAVGVIPRGDDSYNIDVEAHPEWDDLHDAMARTLSQADLQTAAPDLVNRGFRPQDVETLQAFVAANNPDTASAAKLVPLTLEFGRIVRKFDKTRRPVPEGLAMSYFYQRARAHSESNRLWVESLLEHFDAQRGRVLMSTFLEMKPVVIWIPDDLGRGIEELLTEVRRPDFEQRVKAEAKGIAP